MNYFPILVSKAGELTALQHLTQSVKNQTSPIIQILPGQIDNVQNFLTNHWSFANNSILIDFSLHRSADTIELTSFFNNLSNSSVNAVPVIQQNSPQVYLSFVAALISNSNYDICIRASNNSGGFLNYNSQVSNIMQNQNIQARNTILLLDFGYVTQNDYNVFASFIVNLIQNIPNANQYRNIIISGGSFPTDLSNLAANRVHLLQRYEWDMWQSASLGLSNRPNVKYGDYGTKYPFHSEANFQGTCSIKYTTQSHFVIYRGELSRNHPNGNGQYIIFSNQLVTSQYYSGATFSWGDDRIQTIANQNITSQRTSPGNAGTWVQISQNHHLTLLDSLL